MKKRAVPIWVAYAGGGVFFILNIITKGAVPGGFKGGLAGAMLVYGVTWIIFQFLPPVKVEDQENLPEKGKE